MFSVRWTDVHVAIGFDRSPAAATAPVLRAAISMPPAARRLVFPALSTEFLEMSCVNMIQPNVRGKAIESASPPELKGSWIKSDSEHPPAFSYQIVDSLFDSSIADPLS